MSSERRRSTSSSARGLSASVRASESASISAACGLGFSLPAAASSGRRDSALLCTRFRFGLSRTTMCLPAPASAQPRDDDPWARRRDLQCPYPICKATDVARDSQGLALASTAYADGKGVVAECLFRRRRADFAGAEMPTVAL